MLMPLLQSIQKPCEACKGYDTSITPKLDLIAFIILFVLGMGLYELNLMLKQNII